MLTKQQIRDAARLQNQLANAPPRAVTAVSRLCEELAVEKRDAGALANAVGRYLDGGCNDEAGLQAALSAWAHREVPAENSQDQGAKAR